MDNNQILLEKAQSILDKLQNMKASLKPTAKRETTPVIDVQATDLKPISGSQTKHVTKFNFSAPAEQSGIADGIALVQSFYGTDVRRIRATTSALKQIVRSAVKPAEWIFVEAQKTKSDACFRWLKAYGIKYVFVEIPKESEGIFLKTPLWNIGAQLAKADRLCFVDSDVAFEQSEWLENVSDSFNEYDVMSLSQTCSYEKIDITDAPTLGKTYVDNKTAIEEGRPVRWGRCGLTFGITRDAYCQIGGFKCSIMLDDVLYWYDVLGYGCPYNNSDWMINGKDDRNLFGIDVRVGYAPNSCCHFDHGSLAERKYSLHMKLMSEVDDPTSLFTYDPLKSDLPVWNSTPIAQAVKKTIAKMDGLMTADDLQTEFAFNILEEEGNCGEDASAVVAIPFEPSFRYKWSHVIEAFKTIDHKCLDRFTAVCISHSDLPDDSRIMSVKLDADDTVESAVEQLRKSNPTAVWELDRIQTNGFRITELGRIVDLPDQMMSI